MGTTQAATLNEVAQRMEDLSPSDHPVTEKERVMLLCDALWIMLERSTRKNEDFDRVSRIVEAAIHA